MYTAPPAEQIHAGAIIDLMSFASFHDPSGNLVGFSGHWVGSIAGLSSGESRELMVLLRRGPKGNGKRRRPWAGGRWQFGWPSYSKRLRIAHAGEFVVPDGETSEGVFRAKFDELFGDDIAAERARFRFRAFHWQNTTQLASQLPTLLGGAAQFYANSNSNLTTPRAGFWMQTAGKTEGTAGAWLRPANGPATDGLRVRESTKVRSLRTWMAGAGPTAARFVGAFKVSTGDQAGLPADIGSLFPG